MLGNQMRFNFEFEFRGINSRTFQYVSIMAITMTFCHIQLMDSGRVRVNIWHRRMIYSAALKMLLSSILPYSM